MMDKEYFRNYYKNHKKEYRGRDKKWRKNNPEKVKAIKERYMESLLGKRKKGINKTDYGKTSLKGLFIDSYGKDLRNKKDDVTNTEHQKRMICVDCIHYKHGKILKGCPGWDRCPFKKEILKEISIKK